jgi:hypothetical protein
VSLRRYLLWGVSFEFRGGFFKGAGFGDFCFMLEVLGKPLDDCDFGDAGAGADGDAGMDAMSKSNDLNSSQSFCFGVCPPGVSGTMVVARLDTVVCLDSFRSCGGS